MSLPRTIIGVCAYNEENNIRHLLQNLVSEQSLPDNCKILVICSGCTDKTPQVVEEFHVKDEKIEPIIEKTRNGKAAALNKIFQIAKDSADVLILVNADALPQSGTVKLLISQLMKSKSGATFAQPVPFRGPKGVCYKIVGVIWQLHHLISTQQRPKLSGELCAIRTSCLQPIPENIATDEPYIELAIHKQGYSILYFPQAVVHIRCPTNIVDLLKQRKRIWVGHMQLQKATGHKVSTSNFRNILRMASALKPSEIFYAAIGGCLELIAYSQANIESRKGTIPYAWEPIRSTKTSI